MRIYFFQWTKAEKNGFLEKLWDINGLDWTYLKQLFCTPNIAGSKIAAL